MTNRQRPAAALALAALVLGTAALRADEGFWPFNAVPRAAIKSAYGFDVTDAWLDHLRRSSVRFGGASGSFVSPDGLVMTNHHVGLGRAGVESGAVVERVIAGAGEVEAEAICRIRGAIADAAVHFKDEGLHRITGIQIREDHGGGGAADGIRQFQISTGIAVGGAVSPLYRDHRARPVRDMGGALCLSGGDAEKL